MRARDTLSSPPSLLGGATLRASVRRPRRVAALRIASLSSLPRRSAMSCPRSTTAARALRRRAPRLASSPAFPSFPSPLTRKAPHYPHLGRDRRRLVSSDAVRQSTLSPQPRHHSPELPSPRTRFQEPTVFCVRHAKKPTTLH